MGETVTTVPIFTADQWAKRLIKLYPHNWTSDAAKQAGGILYSMFNVPGSQLNYLQNGLNWVLDATRLATAHGDALDSFARDYFGQNPSLEPTIEREPGQSDDAFRAIIKANLLQSGGTRPDIIRVVELLTGETPRYIEPWNPSDTSAVDQKSFCGVDTPDNPCRAGGWLPFQGFVESVLPPFSEGGNGPIYAVDKGLSCNRSYIIEPDFTWFIGIKELDQAINRVRMANTVAWRKYSLSNKVKFARASTFTPAAGTGKIGVDLVPTCEQSVIVLCSACWNTTAVPRVTNEGHFDITFTTPAPGGKTVDWIAAPATLPGWRKIPVFPKLSNSKTFMVPLAGKLVLATPSWATNIWMDGDQDTQATFNFNVPSPAGGMLYLGSFDSDHSDKQAVAAGSYAVSVTFPEPITDGYQLIINMGWDSQYGLTKTNGGFSLTFEVAPDVDSFFCWGLMNTPV